MMKCGGGVVDKDRNVVLKFHEPYAEFVKRAKNCVNACEGMSDEDIQEAMKEFGNLNNVIKRMADIHDAMEYDFNEAIGLLKSIHQFLDFKVNPIHEKKYKFMKLIKHFLDRIEATK